MQHLRPEQALSGNGNISVTHSRFPLFCFNGPDVMASLASSNRWELKVPSEGTRGSFQGTVQRLGSYSRVSIQ